MPSKFWNFPIYYFLYKLVRQKNTIIMEKTTIKVDNMEMH